MRARASLLSLAGSASISLVAHAQPISDQSAREMAELRARLDQLESEVERLRNAASEPHPPAPPKTAPRHVDDLELSLSLLGEIDYRAYPSEVEGNSGFALARLRPGFVLSPASWFRASVVLELAGEHADIVEAYMRFRAADWVELTLGYSKPPMFASFVYEPVHTLPFPDRAPVVGTFGGRRDLGADVHFMPRQIPVEAWLRVGNGTGSALGNDNALPAGYASLDLVLGRAWRGARPQDRTFGLRLGAAGMVESPRDRDGIVGETPLGFVYYRPNVVSGLRLVGEGHAVTYAGPVRLSIEGAIARESRSRDDDGNPSTPRMDLPEVESYGLTAELAWAIFGRPREVGRAPEVLVGEDGSWQGGALEVAARYDGAWLGQAAPDVKPGGSQGGALALKWWPVDFLAATVAGYLTRYDVAPIEAPDDLWSWGVIARASFFWGMSTRPELPLAGHAR